MNKRINDITNLTFNFIIDYCCCSSSAFNGARQFNGDLSTWDVSRVTNLYQSKCSHQIFSFSFPFNQAKLTLTFNNCFFFLQYYIMHLHSITLGAVRSGKVHPLLPQTLLAQMVDN